MMQQDERKLWQTVDQRRQVYVELLQNLVRASEGGEEATQAFVADKFKDFGCDQVELVKANPRDLTIEHEFVEPARVEPVERISVIGKREGTGGGSSMLFWAHPDTPPVSDAESWEHKPFSGEVDGNRLYGWGASDDLAGVAVMACALEAVLHADLPPAGSVLLGSTASKGYAQGIIAALERGYRADASIYLHPAESEAGLKDIKAVTCGQLMFRIVIPGRPPDTTEPGHIVFYHQAVNPVSKIGLIHQALRQLDRERGERTSYPPLEQAVGRATNLDVTFVRCGGDERPSRVDDRCELVGAVLFPPGEKLSSIQAEIRQAVESAAQQDAWLQSHPPQIEWVRGVSSGTEVPPDHPLYQAVEGAITRVTGIKPRNYLLHPGSDIRNPILHSDIPTVGFGPLGGSSTQIGGHDEWVDLDEYIQAVKIAGSIILTWCGVQTAS
jgi:acetylornithine deacetylase